MGLDSGIEMGSFVRERPNIPAARQLVSPHA